MLRLLQPKYEEPPDTPDLENEPLTIHHRDAKKSAKTLLVFVHGLGGTRYGEKATWGDYPKLIFANFPSIDVGLYAYRTLFKRLRLWKSILLEKEAEVFADLLRGLKEYRQFILFGHSMGGVLCKGVVEHLVVTNQFECASKIQGIVLMATPQAGSLRVPRGLAWLSKDFQALKPHNRYLNRIEDVFRNQIHSDIDYPFDDKLHIPCWALRAAEDFWVDPLSAGLGIRAEQKSTVRGTHTSIVKPKSLDEDGFRFTTEVLKQTLSRHAALFRSDKCTPARFNELRTIYELAVRLFGTDVSNLRSMREWLNVNPKILWAIRRVTTRPGQRVGEIVGYICVIPLNGDAAMKIRRGDIKGSSITLHHITARKETPMALYIGAIAGTDLASKAASLHYLASIVQNFSADRKLKVLTRPVTEDGLRIVEGHSMTPVNGEGGLGEVYEAELGDI